jgi:hypothetical protein
LLLCSHGWARGGSGPWKAAPIHMFLILDPAFGSIGTDESHGFDGMRTSFGRCACPERFPAAS